MRITQSGPADPSEPFNTIDPGGPCVIDLPPAESCIDAEYTFKVMPGVAVAVCLRATNGNSIDRKATWDLTDGQCVTIRSDGGTLHPTQNGLGWLVI